MALYSVSAGGTILAADLDQYLNLLTGAMTDQPVKLGNTLEVVGAVTADSTLHAKGAVTADGAVTVAGVLDANGGAAFSGAAATPTFGNGLHVTGGPVNFDSGVTTASVASAGAVSGTSGTFTGAVQSHSHPVVEGTPAAGHLEAYPAQGSVAAVASNSSTSVTFTFARAFTAVPAVTALCQTSAGNVGSIGYGLTAVSVNSCTVAFQNLDANPQTLSNFSIIAAGV